MFAGHHQFAVLVCHLHRLYYQAETRFFVIGFGLDLYFCADRIPDKHGADEPEAVVAIGHGDFVDEVSGKADSDTENKRAVSDTMFKRLGIAPFLVHMMREKIARLPGMENDIRFRDRTT